MALPIDAMPFLNNIVFFSFIKSNPKLSDFKSTVVCKEHGFIKQAFNIKINRLA